MRRLAGARGVLGTRPGRRLLPAVLLLLVYGGATGCGSGASASGADAVDGGEFITVEVDVAEDVEPPEFRDVRVELKGEVGLLLDLNNGPASPAIPEPVPASFTVFAKDDRTAAEHLVVTLLDQGSGEPLTEQAATFSNGLWRVETVVAPGARIVVRAADEEGNAAVWSYGLEVPTLTEAVTGNWTTRLFDLDQVLQYIWESEWKADGTWEEDQGTMHVGGDWAVDGTLLGVARTWSTLGDMKKTTVEWKRHCAFYVDDVYFHECPYVRSDEGEGIEGTWNRVFEEQPATVGLGTPGSMMDVGEVLMFAEDGSWVHERTEVVMTEEGLENTETVSGGTYSVELSDNYVEDFGDFLTLTADSRDGVPAEPMTQVILFRVLAGRLLLNMKIRK